PWGSVYALVRATHVRAGAPGPCCGRPRRRSRASATGSARRSPPGHDELARAVHPGCASGLCIRAVHPGCAGGGGRRTSGPRGGGTRARRLGGGRGGGAAIAIAPAGGGGHLDASSELDRPTQGREGEPSAFMSAPLGGEDGTPRT